MGRNRKKDPKFINLPSYPGGHKALGEFLKQNQKYPGEALNQRIEGIVHITFDVDHMGRVSNPKVIHGLGFGCDDEAIRLVKLLKYNKTYNRGLRVKKRMTLRIPFAPQQEKLNLMYKYIAEDGKKKDTPASSSTENIKEDKKDDNTYGYTIRF